MVYIISTQFCKETHTPCFRGWITSLEQMLRQFKDINLSTLFLRS